MYWLIQVKKYPIIFDNLTICPVQEFIQRWAVPENITSGLVGEPGEGTTIDVDEPFLLR